MHYKFSIKGSEGNLYTVLLKEDDGVFNLTCDCIAGSYGKKCKHKTSVIEDISSGNISDVSQSDFMGSELYSHYLSLKESEAELELAKKNVKRMTARLERLMAG
ncbi:hypothetical protein A9R10_02180 [Aeromonas piscicola]|nr:hypothetical protein A9R10_02180 [Aeromonas piscicola]